MGGIMFRNDCVNCRRRSTKEYLTTIIESSFSAHKTEGSMRVTTRHCLTRREELRSTATIHGPHDRSPTDRDISTNDGRHCV